MIELGPATENDMVLAFVRAEIDSPRFGGRYHHCLAMLGSDCRLIDNADVMDAQQNAVRQKLLGCTRGYGKNTALFSDFPFKVAMLTRRREPWQPCIRLA